MGGRELTPGQGVYALEEALEVIRATWSGEAVTVAAYLAHRRYPGPRRCTTIEIWLAPTSRGCWP